MSKLVYKCVLSNLKMTFTQKLISFLFCGNHQAAVNGRYTDRQTAELMISTRHVAYHGEQTHRVRITGRAEPTDHEPTGERQAGGRRKTSAVCGVNKMFRYSFMFKVISK